MKITAKEPIQFVEAGNVWGTINGTLSDQVDLQEALDLLVPYTGATANINLNTRSIFMPSGSIKDAAGLDSFNANNRELFAPSGVSLLNWAGAVTIYDSYAVGSAQFTSRELYDSALTAALSWSSRELIDLVNVRSLNWNSRELLDAGGIYPSVDWGNYGLINIGVTNAGSLLDWSTGAGGSVKIYGGSTRELVGDFSNSILYNVANASPAYNWANYQLYDDFNSVSIDHNFHLLQFLGQTKIDWQNATAFDTGAILSIHWQDRLLYDASGIFSVDYSLRTLTNSAGTNVLNWSSSYARARSRFSISSVGALSPVSELHIDSGNATASALKFTAGTTTGQTSTDGFDLGITTTGIAEIRQRENLALDIYTNNTLRWTWLAAGGATVADAFNFAFNATTGTKLGTATTQKLAFHNSTPVIQRAGAAQSAAAATAATNVAPFGFTTAAQADAIVTLVNEIRAALVEKGLIKGSA